MKIKDKIALVTGGTKGIGRACVLALAQAGAAVIVNYSSDEKAAEKLGAELRALGAEFMLVKADVSSTKQVDEMFKQITGKYLSIDIVINNAGIFDEADSPINYDAFKKVFDTNLFGQVYVTSKAMELMGQGKIVFTSSVHGQLGHGRPSAAAYSASKAALNSYVKNLAKAVAPKILVNAVAPGRTETPMWGDMDENYKAKMAEGHLINRWIRPEEIADGVMFLVKNDAFCGEVLTIDGGMSERTLG